MLTLSLYKQYQEYRKCLRDSATELSTFLERFEKHILELEEIIYEHCTIPELKILNFLLSCNLSDEDIEKVLVWSEGCTEICPENANGNDSKNGNLNNNNHKGARKRPSVGGRLQVPPS